MGAAVSIDFRIGGADQVIAMTKSVSQALDNEVRAAQAREKAASKAQSAILKQRLAMDMATLKAHLSRTSAAMAADIATNKQNEAARTALALAGSKERTRIAEAEAKVRAKVEAERVRAEAASQRQARTMAATDARRAERESARVDRERVSAQGAFRGVVGDAVVRGAGNGVRAVVGGVKAGASAIAQGVGFDSSVGGAIKRNTDLELQAVKLSNAAYMAGADGAQGQRQDPKALLAEARAAAAVGALPAGDALEGLKGFQAITGDLATGRVLLQDMAKLAVATDSNLSDVVKTAGEFSKAMGGAAKNEEEAKQRAQAVFSVMRGYAGQGKFGSIEMGDNAKYGARLAAASLAFGGDKADNLLKMGALSQFARGGGGAWNAATSANAVSAFVNTVKTPARQKAFKANGVELFGADKKLRAPEEIIMDSLSNTGGDLTKMKQMWGNVMGERAVEGFSQIFREATGGKSDKASVAKGRAAVSEAMTDMLRKTMMTQAQIEEDASKVKGTTAARGIEAQQKFDQAVSNTTEKVIPELAKLAPAAEKAGAGLAKLVEGAANNPVGAIAGVIAAFVAKELATVGVTSLAKSVATPTGAGVGAAAALGVTIGSLTAMGANADLDKQQAEQNRSQSEGINILSRVSSKDATAQDRADAEMMVMKLMNQEDTDKGFLGHAFEGATAGYRGLAAGDFSAENIASAHPLAALGRGVYQGVLGDQQDMNAQVEGGKMQAELIAALDKPATLAPGSEVAIQAGAVINIGNWGDMPKTGGRDATSQPITGN